MPYLPPDPLVDASLLVPGLVEDVRYAKPGNVFGEPVYDTAVFALRRSVAHRLVRVAEVLGREGLRLVGWDGYRPLAVQRRLWELKPVVGFVAPPERGSNHNRGSAGDLALADAAGNLVDLPCAYDDFSERAHHEYQGCGAEAQRHRALLRAAMEAEGFTLVRMEWWHYDAPDAKSYPLEDVPLRALKGRADG